MPERPHNLNTLRHTAITNVYRATKGLFLIQRFARHADPITSVIYTQYSDEESTRRSPNSRPARWPQLSPGSGATTEGAATCPPRLPPLSRLFVALLHSPAPRAGVELRLRRLAALALARISRRPAGPADIEHAVPVAEDVVAGRHPRP